MPHVDDGTLQAWLDAGRAGLSAAERGEIERHLAACAACAHRAQEAEALDARTRSLLAPSDPSEETIPPFEAVLARARRGRAAGQVGGGQHRRWAAAAWAATIALALGVGWWARDVSRAGEAGRTALLAPAAPAAESRARPAAAPSPTAGSAKPAQPGVPVAETPAPTVEPAQAPRPPVQVAEAPARLLDRAQAPESRARVAQVPTQSADRAQPPERSAGAERRTETPTAPLAAGDVRAKPPEIPQAPPPAIQEANAFAAGVAQGVVRGRVTDDSGRPLASAQVMLEGTRIVALTRADGTFSLALGAVPMDSATRQVTVTARLLGYASASRSLAVPSGADAFTELRLSPGAVALSAIVVTGYGTATRGAAGWTPTTRADAERQAGFRLLTVPDLAVPQIEVHDTPGHARVRVVQQLEGGSLLELVESREPLSPEQTFSAARGASASVRRGDVYVVAAAPIDSAALAALLGRLR